MEFDVFLSHNSSDKPAVRELNRLLAASGLMVRLEGDELQPAYRGSSCSKEVRKT
jgi:hypothetical protein